MSSVKSVALTLSSVLLSAAFAASAQEPGQAPNAGTSSTGTPNTYGTPINVTPPNNGPVIGAGGTDGDFVAKAAAAGHEEVAEARQAIKDTSRPDVKRVAAMLRRDHRAADRKLARIAKRDGLALPPLGGEPNTTAAGYSDSDYISSQIKAHRDAIQLFKNESQNGQNPQVRAFARQTLPTLQHHLHALEKLQDA
jgi:putative membrane protein